jgi:RNA polymerase sigma factor (sigma-70 family)
MAIKETCEQHIDLVLDIARNMFFRKQKSYCGIGLSLDDFESEATQCLLEIIKTHKQNHGNTDVPKGWVVKKTRWTLSSMVSGLAKKKSRTLVNFYPTLHPRPVPDERYGNIESKEIVKRLMKILSPKQRLIVRLRFFKDLDVKEIANLIGTTKGMVYKHLDKIFDTCRLNLEVIGCAN